MRGPTAGRSDERSPDECRPRVGEDQPWSDDLHQAGLFGVVEARRGFSELGECRSHRVDVAARFRCGNHECASDPFAVVGESGTQVVGQLPGGAGDCRDRRPSAALIGGQPVDERHRQTRVTTGDLGTSPSGDVGDTAGDQQRLDVVVGERLDPDRLAAGISPRARADGGRDDGHGIDVEVTDDVPQGVDRVGVDQIDVVDQDHHRAVGGELSDRPEHIVAGREVLPAVDRCRRVDLPIGEQLPDTAERPDTRRDGARNPQHRRVVFDGGGGSSIEMPAAA